MCVRLLFIIGISSPTLLHLQPHLSSIAHHLISPHCPPPHLSPLPTTSSLPIAHHLISPHCPPPHLSPLPTTSSLPIAHHLISPHFFIFYFLLSLSQIFLTHLLPPLSFRYGMAYVCCAQEKFKLSEIYAGKALAINKCSSIACTQLGLVRLLHVCGGGALGCVCGVCGLYAYVCVACSRDCYACGL